MNHISQTSIRPVPQQASASSSSNSMYKESVCIKQFLFQLEGFIQKKNHQDAESMITSCRTMWSALNAQDVGELIELAMKCRAPTLIKILVDKCEPGKAAELPLETQVKLVWGRQTFGEPIQVLNILTNDAICPEDHRESLIKAYIDSTYSISSEKTPEEIGKTFGRRNKELQPFRRQIYEAASTGSAHDLQNALDSAFGLPPLDDSLQGADWIFNRLHRWFMEAFRSGDIKQLLNEQIANTSLLHVAVKSGDVEKVQLLVDKGARPSIEDKDERTALWWAKEYKNQALITLLETSGAVDETHRPCTYQRYAGNSNGNGFLATDFVTPDKTAAARMSWQETKELFNALLPNVAHSFSNPRLLQQTLNAGKVFTEAQAELCTAGYLAKFEYSTALTGLGRGQISHAEIEDLADELERYQSRFRSQGDALEAQTAAAIHLALDIGFSLVPRVSEEALRSELQNGGLCNFLIDAVIAALDTACKDQGWEYRATIGKKHAIAGLLAKRLASIRSTLVVPGLNESDLALPGRLLLRQISLLDLYCEAVKEVDQPIWRKIRDR